MTKQVNPPQVLKPAFSSISFPVIISSIETTNVFLSLRAVTSSTTKTSPPNLSPHIIMSLCGLLLAVTSNHIDFTSSLSCPIASNYSWWTSTHASSSCTSGNFLKMRAASVDVVKEAMLETVPFLRLRKWDWLVLLFCPSLKDKNYCPVPCSLFRKCTGNFWFISTD